LFPRYIEVIKKVLPSCVLFSPQLGATSETGQNNNKAAALTKRCTITDCLRGYISGTPEAMELKLAAYESPANVDKSEHFKMLFTAIFKCVN
jgi:hypothetical protein